MKSDLYTKCMLTVIAACLMAMVFQNSDIPKTAFAKEPTPVTIVKVGYKPVTYALPVEIHSSMVPK